MFKKLLAPTVMALLFLLPCACSSKDDAKNNETANEDVSAKKDTTAVPEEPDDTYLTHDLEEYKGKFSVPYLVWETWYATQPGEKGEAETDGGVDRISMFTFSPLRRSYSYFDGCNVGGASYTIFAPDSIAFDQGPMTLKACRCPMGVGIPEYAKVTPKIVAGDTTVHVSIDGQLVQVWRRPGKWMFVGNWEVTTVNGSPVSDNIVLNFSANKKSVKGIYGDSSFGGSFNVEPGKIVEFKVSGVSAKNKQSGASLKQVAEALKTVGGYDFSFGDCQLRIQLFNEEMGSALEMVRSVNN